MFGATPYIEHWFQVNEEDAKKFLTTWMETFNDK